jgi:type II secretory pathway predicted ATPase ExeA
MSSNLGSVTKLLSSLDARKTLLEKALLSSRSGDDCCLIRPLVLWSDYLINSGRIHNHFSSFRVIFYYS